MSDGGPVATLVGSRAAGLSWQDAFVSPPHEMLTGVPAFLGYAGGTDDSAGHVDEPQLLTLWSHLEQRFGPAPATGYLAPAIRGFFENGGQLCYVVRLGEAPVPPEDALAQALDALDNLDDIDLVCAPDIMRGADQPDREALERIGVMQQLILDHCHQRGDRFAILDCVNTGDVGGDRGQAGEAAAGSSGAGSAVSLLDQRGRLQGADGALYHPWLLMPDPGTGNIVTVPPSGHVAGVYSQTDQLVGCHKAPANQALAGALDLRHHLTEGDTDRLAAIGVNGIRAFPGQGLRVWGARTLGTSQDPLTDHVNVRRLFVTVTRWLEQFNASVSFESNDLRLWLRIMRELSAYCEDLFRRGALKGRVPEEAFYVKCDGDTNPHDVISAGMVVTELGLAPIAPAQFIVVRIIHGTSGVSLSPLGPAA